MPQFIAYRQTPAEGGAIVRQCAGAFIARDGAAELATVLNARLSDRERAHGVQYRVATMRAWQRFP